MTAIKVKERPILFSGAMVRAILDGRKTQTRRVVKPQPPSKDWLINVAHAGQDVSLWNDHGKWRMCGAVCVCREAMGNQWPKGHEWKCSYGAVGDRLWVRETWAVVPQVTDNGPKHKAKGDGTGATWRASWDGNPSGFKWKPSIHMPRWASRLTLEICGVRVERLNDISEWDAISEGAMTLPNRPTYEAECAEAKSRGEKRPPIGDSPRHRFQRLWIEINGEESWSFNPWVWVVEFKKLS